MPAAADQGRPSGQGPPGRGHPPGQGHPAEHGQAKHEACDLAGRDEPPQAARSPGHGLATVSMAVVPAPDRLAFSRGIVYLIWCACAPGPVGDRAVCARRLTVEVVVTL
jgi:hypothetical protein